MYVLAVIGLGIIQAASAYFIVKGLGALVRKRWRGASAVLLGLVLFGAYALVLGVAAYWFGAADLDGTQADPTSKARVLGENIASLMNASVWGAPLGLVLAIIVLIRNGRTPRPVT